MLEYMSIYSFRFNFITKPGNYSYIRKTRSFVVIQYKTDVTLANEDDEVLLWRQNSTKYL